MNTKIFCAILSVSVSTITPAICGTVECSSGGSAQVQYNVGDAKVDTLQLLCQTGGGFVQGPNGFTARCGADIKVDTGAFSSTGVLTVFSSIDDGLDFEIDLRNSSNNILASLYGTVPPTSSASLTYEQSIDTSLHPNGKAMIPVTWGGRGRGSVNFLPAIVTGHRGAFTKDDTEIQYSVDGVDTDTDGKWHASSLTTDHALQIVVGGHPEPGVRTTTMDIVLICE